MAQTFLSVTKKFLTKNLPIYSKFIIRTTIEFSRSVFSQYKTFRVKFEEDHIGKIINIKRRFRKFKIQLKAKSKKNEKIKKLRNLEFKRLLIKPSIKLKSGVNKSILIKERFNSGLNLIRMKSFYTNRVLPILRSLTKVVNNNYYLSLEYLKRGYKLLDKTIHSSNFNKFIILVFFIFGAFIVEDQLDRIKITQKVPGDEKAVNINATSNTDLVFEYDYELTTKTKILKYIIHPALASDENQPQLVLTDYDGKKHNPEFVVDREGEESFSVRIAQNKIPPGAYEALLEVYKDGVYYQQGKIFTYGVLSINTNKATFTPGEEITLNMGALKNDGHTICDADLELKITSPSGKQSSPVVTQSGFCERDNVTNVPDYLASHKAEEVGRHKMTLVNKDNGYQIEDFYEVQAEVPYSIERKGPSRIYPFVAYPMEIIVTANQDFTGKIIEKVPKGFLIKGMETSSEDDWQTLTWDVDLKNGEDATYTYFFDAPDISPFLYLTGPLEIGDYQEVRMWQIASDADGSGTNVVVPTGVLVSSTDQTFTFTYDPSELFNSGELAIKVPTSRGWSTPQGSAGTAGYTTVSGSGNTTIGEVLVSGDSTSQGVWTLTEDDSDMCNTTASPFVDTTTKKEGSGAIQCNNSGSAAPDDTDTFSFDATAQNWSSYTQISFWLRSTKALTSAAGIDFGYDNNAAFGSPTAIFDTGTVSANTWTYFVFDMTGTRTAITAFGLICDTTGCDSNTFWLDEVMVGPSSPTFVANGPDVDIRARFIDLASTDTVTVTYGAGGGTSGADVPVTSGLDEFTTRTRFDAGGTLTNISSHPTVNVENPSINISGSCKQDDQTTNCTDTGTIKVAINGSIQAQVQNTVAGTWTISGITSPNSGDVVTVFIDGAGEADEAVAVTTYDGSGNVEGMELIEQRMTIGNNDNRTISNVDLAAYDNGVSGDEDIFHEIDGSNDLTMIEASKPLAELYIKTGNTYRPASDNTGNVTVNDFEIPSGAIFTSDANTITIKGDSTPFVVGGTFNEDTSTFKYTSASATSITPETYYHLSLEPSAAGSPTYTLNSGTYNTRNLTIGNGTNPVTINWTTNDPAINVGGNLLLNANSTWTKSDTATLTFNGATTPVSLTDNNSTKQDLGKLSIDGPKEVNVGSSITLQSINVTAGDTLDLQSSGNELVITGSGIGASRPFINDGSTNLGNSTVNYVGTQNTEIQANYSTGYYNLRLDQSGTTFTATDICRVTNSFIIENGEYSPDNSTLSLEGSGDIFVVNDTFTAGTSTVLYAGTINTNIALVDYYNLGIYDGFTTSSRTFTIPSGTLNILNNLTVGSISGITNITLDANTNDPVINVTGNMLIRAYGVYLAASNQAYPLSVAGNFTNNGTFTHNNGKVILNSAVDTSQSLLGAVAFHTLEIATGDREVKLGTTGTKSIVANGSLTLTGTDCSNMMRVRTSTNGVQATLSVDVSATASVSLVDLQDINLTTKSITAGNSVNSGNNSTNWTISANGCLGTSTNQDTTGLSFQRKVIYDDQNSRHWSFNHDGDEIEVKYSSDDGSTWTNPTTAASGRLPYNTNDFSVWWKSVSTVEYLVLAVADGGDIKVRQGTLSGTDITWDTDVSVAMNETGTYSRPYITFDTSNHMWVGATYNDGSDYVYKTVVSAEAGSTDPSTWTWSTAPYQLSNAQTSSNVYGTITALSSEDMYATFVVDTELLGCRWDDSDTMWEDAIGASCLTTEGGGEAEYFDTLENGLIANWKMDETSWNGTTGEVIDSTISNYDGTAQGGATTAGAGFNRSGSFAGDNDYINVGDVTELNSTSAFSVSQWVYITDVTADDRIFHKAIDGSYDISIAPYEVTTQRIYFEIGNGSNSFGYWDSTGVISNNSWVHLVAVFDGSGSSNEDKAKIFVNGIERALTYTGTIPSTTADLSSNNLKLGTGDSGEYFTGRLDEVRVYNRAIVPEEVSKLYEYVPDSINIDDASDFGPLPGGSRQIIRTKSGTLYSFLNDAGNCEMWKSLDSVLWSNTDSETCTSGYPIAAAIDASDDIHVVYVDTAGSNLIEWAEYSTGSDSFGTPEQVRATATDHVIKELSIAIDANDVPHVAASDLNTDLIAGYILYRNRTGGTWQTQRTVESLGLSNTPSVDIQINEDNIPEIAYLHPAGNDLKAAVGDVNNAATFTLQNIDTDINDAADQRGLSIEINYQTGDTWISYVDDTNNYIALAKHADADAWSTWSTITTNTNVGYEPNIAVAGNSDIYVFYENDQDDIAYDVYNGTSWAGEVVLHQGTFQDVHVKSSFEWNNYGMNKIDYIYSDGTDIYYDYLYLRRTPTNIDDTSDFGTMLGPSKQIVRSSSGALFAIVLDDTNTLEVWKSTEGASWAELDSTNNPVSLVADSQVALAIDSYDKLHIAYQKSYSMYYQTFDTSSNLFGIEAVVRSGNAGQIDSNPELVIDSEDKPHIIFVQFDGSSEYVSYYSNRISGSWKTPVQFGSASVSSGRKISLTLNEDNIPEMSEIGQSLKDLVASVGNQNDATSFTNQTIDSDTEGTLPSAIAVDSSGNTWMAYVDENGATDYISLMKHNDADAWSTWQTVITNSNDGSEPSIAIDGTDVYVFYENDQDDMVFDMYNGSSWSGEKILEMQGALQDAKPRWSYINNYDSTGTAPVQTNTYFFNGANGVSDPNSAWTNDENAYDASLSTYAQTGTEGSTSTNYLKVFGTNSPASGGTISSVKARVSGTCWDTSLNVDALSAEIHTDGAEEFLGTATVSSSTVSIYGQYLTLDEPTGGWTWQHLQNLEIKFYCDTVSNSPDTARVFHSEILVKSINDAAQIEIDYLYSDGTDVFYNRLLLGDGIVPGVQDSIVTGLSTGLHKNISTVSQTISTIDYVHLAYVNSSGNIYYDRYDGDWDFTNASLDANTDNTYLGLSKDTATSDVYLGYIGSTSDDIFTKKATYSAGPSWSWGTSTTLVTDASEIYTNYNANYTGNGKIGAIYSIGDLSPYNIGWESVLSASANNAPTIDNVVVNGASNISLTAGSTHNVSWTSTVTDLDGYGQISGVTGKLYRSGVSGAETCTPNDNNCYSDAVCDLSGCSGNTCTATCTVAMYFHADATDANSTMPSEYWRGWMEATDSHSETGSEFSSINTPDVESLSALDIVSTVDYGLMLAGDSSSEQATLVTNQGNIIIDLELSGDNMCTDYPTCAGSMISVGQQEYSMSTFTYGSGSDLTTSAVRIQFNLAKPTTSPSNATKNLYWRLGLNSEQTVGEYSGSNVVLSENDNVP